MIQIYRQDNIDYRHNGDMTLLPEEAIIHVILNGEWTANIEHPIDLEGRWKYIEENAVVKMPSFNGIQLFRIRSKEKKDSGVSAELTPIFMDAKEDCFLVDVRPTNKSGQEALDVMTEKTPQYQAKSDIKKVSTAYYQTMNLIEAINGSDDNAFVSRWGGEILYDNYQVIINEKAGGDYGVQVMYGKNIVKDGFSEMVDMSEVATRIVPKSYNGYMIEGDTPWVDSPLIEKYPTIHYRTMKFEDVKMREDAQEDDEENGVTICETQKQLEEALKKKCQEQYDEGVDKPKVTIEADMELLQNTELYEDVKSLEMVSLGDTVHCNHSKLGIKSDARVIELEWDAVRNKLTFVKLGEFQYNFLNNVSSVMSRVDQSIRSDGTVIGQQIQGIINGVKAQMKAQSTVAKKQMVRAILFEDLDPKSETFGAMCLGTLGFEIASERTADGRDWKWTTFGTGQGFYADFIVAGTMLADRIKGGTLILGGKDNGDGTAKVLDANGNVVLALTNQGIVVDHASNGGVLIGNGSIFIRNTKGETVGIMHYQDNGMSIQSYGGQYASILITNEGKISINAVGEVSLSCGSLKVGGKSTKTGRAVYSDGTYLDIQNGHVVGGNTKEGSF
ncbi:MAG: phage tail spike protein [Mediterraneibacter faecis]|nr:phage tail spike protein [Mediterraneibacter faecis]